MKKSKFYLIDMAEWDVPRNQMIRPESPKVEAENRRMIIPSFCVLIQHPELGWVLYDTGVASDKDDFWNEEMHSLYSFIRLEDFRGKLAELQLAPADIDMLILSHLHYDHAGNLRAFAHTKAGWNVIVSEDELKDAKRLVEESSNGVAGAYYEPEFMNIDGIHYKTVQGDTKLADGLEVIFLKGHTEGLLGLLVETEHHGTVIFPSDAVYSSYHFGPPIIYPGLCADPESYKENIEKLDRIRKERNATIIFSHDIDAFRELKKSPEYYD